MVTWKSCSIITAWPPGDPRWPLVDLLSTLCPSRPLLKRLKLELQSTQSLPSALIGAAGRGVKGRDPQGSAAHSPGYYIMFIWMKGQASICASRPVGRLWSWLPPDPSASLWAHVWVKPPQGQIWVKAITPRRLKLLKLLCQGPGMLWVTLWPLSHRGGWKITPPVKHGRNGPQ